MYSIKSFFFSVLAKTLAAEWHCAVGCWFLLSLYDRWLPVGLLVGCCDKFKPLPQRIAQGLWQGVDVPQDDVEGKGELLHVGADFWQLSRPFEYGHLDVQDGVLQHHQGSVIPTFILILTKRSNAASLTRELGLSSMMKMTNTFALHAACTAVTTRSFPSRKSPLPSDTMTSSWAVSV